MSKTTEKSQGETKSAGETETKSEAGTQTEDLAHPHHAVHSDNAKSKMPERPDEGHKQSPADRPGKKRGEGEPSVG
ncbi:hypothetical protein [Paraburkholderia atlantica]|uniref:Uncharacterized protein n=1 Tax=Paraburkholderia atlantica TaxID=2654982 RepID=D5W8I7_PARAM|nr:hypothetical protein [Paraburkholderia atlantica]ADG15732.1 hypothetical protein BC1002_1666 [Paraburkholderia atlantica]MBB5509822.1 hypothetical protein [Paraburkholderia atlantica]